MSSKDKVTRHSDAYRKSDGHDGFIGDDLDSDDLHDLWCTLSGYTELLKETTMSGWWSDKPHQIAYRLLLRLTRAEDKGEESQRLLDAQALLITKLSAEVVRLKSGAPVEPMAAASMPSAPWDGVPYDDNDPYEEPGYMIDGKCVCSQCDYCLAELAK